MTGQQEERERANRPAPRRHEVVPAEDAGYGRDSGWIVRYFDPDVGVWFDYGDPVGSLVEAQAKKSEAKRSAALGSPVEGRAIRRYQVHYGSSRNGHTTGYVVTDAGEHPTTTAPDGPVVFASDNKSDVVARADELNEGKGTP